MVEESMGRHCNPVQGVVHGRSLFVVKRTIPQCKGPGVPLPREVGVDKRRRRDGPAGGLSPAPIEAGDIPVFAPDMATGVFARCLSPLGLVA
jgi:hypothetical protein